MMNISRRIIEKYIINDAKCCKFMSKDGITTQELAIEKVDGIFDSVQMDARPESTLPAVARACGILKNLDDYQYIVCSEIRGIPDSSPYKKILQKYRVTIVAAFARFVIIIRSKIMTVLQEWIHFAQLLLEVLSDTLAKARLNTDFKPSNEPTGLMFDYFGMPEKEVDDLLESIY
jgi:hypothetical protein